MGEHKGKRYRASVEKVPQAPVSVQEAVNAIKGFQPAKFDQTVELVLHLGIDPRQADQAIRGALSLPHGIGKARRVVAFCEADDVDKAKAAGAIEAGGDDLIKKVQDGWTDFDVAVAVPGMMRSVSRLGRLLGPQGKMPSPKSGTVVEDVEKAVREYAAGKLEYRNDDGGNLHVSVGKVSFETEQLVENIEAFVSHIRKLRPASMKGTYIRQASLSATMSPAVALDVA
jgi:large subunit ribosomal protein L1